jgi:hypothetical protein
MIEIAYCDVKCSFFKGVILERLQDTDKYSLENNQSIK